MKKFLLIIFSIFFTLFILLLSYKTVLVLIPTTIAQQETIEWLYSKGDLTVPYAPLELSHLQDVKRVMFKADLVFYLSVLVIASILLFYRKDKETLLSFLKTAVIAEGIFVIVTLISLLLGFNYTFNLFHDVFFPQGNWQFAADSVLIQTFPIEFFSTIGLSIFAFALGIVLLPIMIILGNRKRAL